MASSQSSVITRSQLTAIPLRNRVNTDARKSNLELNDKEVVDVIFFTPD